MRFTLDTRAALAHRLPGLDQVPGRKHRAERQRHLTKMFGISYERLKPHAADATKDSFSRDYLRRGLRVGKRPDATAGILRPFYEFPEGNRGYRRDRKETKAYALRPEILDAMHAVYRDPASLPVMLEDARGGEMLGPWPTNGSPIESLAIPAVIPLPLVAVDMAITRVEQWIAETSAGRPLDPDKPQKTTLAEALHSLRVSRKWVASLGGLPNLYQEQDSGRLGPVGFHLITLPARLRHLLFADSGLWEYDLSSCHWRIFSSVAASLGIETPYVNDYIDDRQGWMDHWQGCSGHFGVHELKAIATSWFTGGTLSSSPQTTSGKLVGSRVMKLLRADDRTCRLYDEIRRGMRQIVAASQLCTEGTFVNAIGARPATKEYNTVCSHLLSGYEQFIIRQMCQCVSSLTAVIYDGWISRRVPDVRALEEHVRQYSQQHLGVTLDMRVRATDFSVGHEAIALPSLDDTKRHIPE